MTKAQRNQEFENHIKEVAGALRDEGVTFVLAAKTRDGGAVTYSNGENDNLLALTTILVDHLSDWLPIGYIRAQRKSSRLLELVLSILEKFKKGQGK